MIGQQQSTLEVRIKSIVYEAEGVLSYTLKPLDGKPLPPFTAGAHIDLHLPGELIRSYSLLNSQDERHRYVVAVNRDPLSRGGSAFMHEQLRVGSTLRISAPRNNFELKEDAAGSLFIAGGIGITPLLSMIRRLVLLGRPWQLYYCARTRQHAAFLDELRALSPIASDCIHTNFDQEPGGRMLDLDAVIALAAPDVHLYCCGPLPMLAAFERATGSRGAEHVHVEYFSAKEPAAAEGGFKVELARMGKTLAVPAGKTILQVLLDAGMDVPYSCMEGACAACETRVLEGVPDHRDVVLSREEQNSNKTMMICCSGCKSDKLVLDI